MSTEIKNTLFRFVTMRSPELPEETNKDKRFVYRIANESGFDNAVTNRPIGTSKWAAMKNFSETFNPVKEEGISDYFNHDLQQFAIWITRNKYSYTASELANKVTGLGNVLNTVDRTVLWDNFFYQVITQKDFYLKEIFMQLLVAVHVLENFDANNTKLLKHLMNAKVVLPKKLFVEDVPALPNTPLEARSVEEGEEQTITLPSEEMKRVQAISQSNANIERHRKLKKELQKVEKIYNRDYKIAYDLALEQYEEDIKPILATYEAALEAERQNWCTVRDPQVPYNPNDPCDNPVSIPKPELPKFEFRFKDQLDLAYFQSVLSAPSYETLLELLEIETEIASRSDIIENFSLDPVMPSFEGLNLLIDDGINHNTGVIIGNTRDKAILLLV
ncbi:hypothetical protein H9W95_11875 [Flavobacterium lindanitolerans]|nr:hypothetical protein [Flavobacterium lindanitolerans]